MQTKRRPSSFTFNVLYLILELGSYVVFTSAQVVLEFIVASGPEIILAIANKTELFDSILPDSAIEWSKRVKNNNYRKRQADIEANKIVEEAAACTPSECDATEVYEEPNIDVNILDENTTINKANKAVDAVKAATCNITIENHIHIGTANIGVISNAIDMSTILKESLKKIENINKSGDISNIDEVLDSIRSELEKVANKK